MVGENDVENDYKTCLNTINDHINFFMTLSHNLGSHFDPVDYRTSAMKIIDNERDRLLKWIRLRNKVVNKFKLRHV